MFTGIIEGLGQVQKIEQDQSNLRVWMKAPFVNELKIDQSVAHNGVCLTVDQMKADQYRVTIIKESLDRSNLGELKIGDEINLERCMPANGRFDGHIVQGHVDTTAVCTAIEDQNGSIDFYFKYEMSKGITVEKGSITINGISLTVVNSLPGQFSVSIIPYTLEHTNLKNVKIGNTINLEFDIVGKYILANKAMNY